ncbi:hypothetical protein PHMEG_00037577, partial [Phytophthora megakarya]
TRTCCMFDPMDGAMMRAKKALCEVIVPLMHMPGEVSYKNLGWCRQGGGSFCGVLYLAALELLLAGQQWEDEIYELIPYLWLRYLSKCIGLLDQSSKERGVRLFSGYLYPEFMRRSPTVDYFV